MAATTNEEIMPRKRVAFSIQAPEAQEVALAGDFNGWDPQARPMKRDATGVWKATLTLPAGTYHYRYVVDGRWVDDPQCNLREANPFGSANCIRVVG